MTDILSGRGEQAGGPVYLMKTANSTAEWVVIPDSAAEAPTQFAPAMMPERRALLLKCREAIDLIHYLKPVRQRTSIDKRQMVILRAELAADHFRLDLVQADLEKVWGVVVRENASAMMRVVDHAGGFDFHFALFRKDGLYETGVIEIRNPGSRR